MSGMNNPVAYQTQMANPLEMGKFILDNLPPLKPGVVKTLLDIGCGTGEFAAELRKRGYHVVAIDVSPEMIASTKETLKKASLQEDETLVAKVCAGQDIGKEFSENSFDFVISCSTLHWLTEAQLDSCLAGVSKVLKKDGVFINSNASKEAVTEKTVSLLQSLLEALSILKIPTKNIFYHINSDTFKTKLRESGLETNAGTIATEQCFSLLPKGPEGWMRTFANNQLDKEKHPSPLSESELESVVAIGSKIYLEKCAKVGKDPNHVSYERHKICVELSKDMKISKDKQEEIVQRKTIISPENIKASQENATNLRR